MKPEQMSLFGSGPVLDVTPKRKTCWRYFNKSKCYSKEHCSWTFKYDANGNKYNCCDMFRCGTCEDCETPAGKYFSGECEHLDYWIVRHGNPWR